MESLILLTRMTGAPLSRSDVKDVLLNHKRYFLRVWNKAPTFSSEDSCFVLVNSHRAPDFRTDGLKWTPIESKLSSDSSDIVHEKSKADNLPIERYIFQIQTTSGTACPVVLLHYLVHSPEHQKAPQADMSLTQNWLSSNRGYLHKLQLRPGGSVDLKPLLADRMALQQLLHDILQRRQLSPQIPKSKSNLWSVSNSYLGHAYALASLYVII